MLSYCTLVLYYRTVLSYCTYCSIIPYQTVGKTALVLLVSFRRLGPKKVKILHYISAVYVGRTTDKRRWGASGATWHGMIWHTGTLFRWRTALSWTLPLCWVGGDGRFSCTSYFISRILYRWCSESIVSTNREELSWPRNVLFFNTPDLYTVPLVRLHPILFVKLCHRDEIVLYETTATCCRGQFFPKALSFPRFPW